MNRTGGEVLFHGLQEEMEPYDLVDLDAPGEPDPLVDIDTFEESILVP
jgi:hypothetical protein